MSLNNIKKRQYISLTIMMDCAFKMVVSVKSFLSRLAASAASTYASIHASSLAATMLALINTKNDD